MWRPETEIRTEQVIRNEALFCGVVEHVEPFSDSGSVPVIHAMGDVLAEAAILRKSREDFADWLASQQVRG